MELASSIDSLGVQLGPWLCCEKKKVIHLYLGIELFFENVLERHA